MGGGGEIRMLQGRHIAQADRCIATYCTAYNMYDVLQHVSAKTRSCLQGVHTKSSIGVKIYIPVKINLKCTIQS